MNLPNPDSESLNILIDATAEVVGEVSKVYQAIRRAIDGGEGIDLLAAARAFDNLPAWQRQKILQRAQERAEETAAPHPAFHDTAFDLYEDAAEL